MMTAQAETRKTDLSKYIDTHFFDGRQPHIRGHRIPVWVIAYHVKGNPDLPNSPGDHAYGWTISEEEAMAALIYYIEHSDEIDATQNAIREEHRHFYQNGDDDKNDRAFLAYPIVTDLSKYIDTEYFDGRQPHIRGRRIPVSVIAYNARALGDTIDDFMRNFDLSEGEVLAALLYYAEHQAEIDAAEKALHEEYKHYYDAD